MHHDLGEIHYHLFIFSIVKSYTIWKWHEQILDIPIMLATIEKIEEGMHNYLKEVINDVREKVLEKHIL